MRISQRTLQVTLVAVLIVALAAHFVAYLRYAFAAVRYPFELFDAEGIVWQQALLIPSPRMYGDINRFPFIVFHYPPVYHLIIRALIRMGIAPLLAGRGVSLLASLATGSLAGWLAFRASRRDTGQAAALVGATIAGLGFFCFFPVVVVSPLMRVDMLAIGFSFLGLCCGIASIRRPRMLYLAMVLFVLAAFTKQTCVIAGLATMIALFPARPAATMKVLFFGLFLGTAGLAILEMSTGGGFLRHIIQYNINRFSFNLLALQIFRQTPHLLMIVVGYLGSIVIWRELARAGRWTDWQSFYRNLVSDEAVQVMAVLTLYLVLSTATLLTLGKSGATLAYFVEWMAVLSVLVGMLMARVVSRQPADRLNGAAGITKASGFILPILLTAQVIALPYSRDFGPTDARSLRQLDELVADIRAATKPVLSEDMVLLMKAGKEVPMEPAIFSELASMGQWDERQIVNMIVNQDFALVITRRNTHFSQAIVQAIQTAYPDIEERAGHTIHLPLRLYQ